MTIEALYAIYQAYPNVTTDTRLCAEGMLFFALRGANFDGNAFAPAALEAGCPYAVVDDATIAATDPRMLYVDDVLVTLQALARHHRQQWGGKVLQITGTNGKTTTKELVAAVLAQGFCVHYTAGNLNNHIGVPLTLLRLRPEHTFAVIETGANHEGEIRLLTDIVQPDFGLITNVGMAHLEGFGSFEGVKRTKGELYDFLRQHHRPAFVYTESEDLLAMAEGLDYIGYATEHPTRQCTVVGELLPTEGTLRFRWLQAGGKAWHKVEMQLVGGYNLPNALAAIAIGLHFHLTPSAIGEALAAYTPSNNRSQLMHTAHNQLIVDAYNANPTSMAAALTNFAFITHPHKVMILGEMRELGAATTEAHAAVVAHAQQLLDAGQCHAVYFVGEAFATIAQGQRMHYFPHVDALATQLATQPIADSLVLIKGSNGTRLFTLPEHL